MSAVEVVQGKVNNREHSEVTRVADSIAQPPRIIFREVIKAFGSEWSAHFTPMSGQSWNPYDDEPPATGQPFHSHCQTCSAPSG
jgi:hypothetical protein